MTRQCAASNSCLDTHRDRPFRALPRWMPYLRGLEVSAHSRWRADAFDPLAESKDPKKNEPACVWEVPVEVVDVRVWGWREGECSPDPHYCGAML